MKRLTYTVVFFLLVIFLVPVGLVGAQTPKTSLPQASIAYPGDTKETLTRRAQWIEEARKEGALVWWGFLAPKEANNVVAEFNRTYPFIKVTYWRGQDTERDMKTEQEHASGRLSVDIGTLGNQIYFPRWRKIGVIEKITDILPGIRNMNRGMYSRYGDWAMPGNNAITPQYNTRLVSKAEAPKTWDDLLDPKWKGQIALTTDVVAWYVLALGEGGWGIDKTEEFLKKLKQQQPIWTAGHSQGHNLLIAGEFKIMGEEYVYHVRRSQEKGAQVDWARINQVPITGPTLSLMKKGPHPNAARLFLEWLFYP